MMDGSAIYPQGFHPSRQERAPVLKREAIPLGRYDVRGIKYFLIDFKYSMYVSDENQNRSASGRFGEDASAPELDEAAPYNPFLVDIFSVGHVIQRAFLEVHGLKLFLGLRLLGVSRHTQIWTSSAPWSGR